MNIQNIELDSMVKNQIYETKTSNNEDFKNLMDKLTGGEIVQEIEDKYDVTLNVGKIGNGNQYINNYDSGCKNYVGISRETLSKMESDPALKKKILGAIEEFCSSEEQAKVNALQPPVKSAGMLIYPNGETLYWLEGYPNEVNGDKGKRISAESKNAVMERYHDSDILQDNTISETSMSILATVIKVQNDD